MAPLVEAGPSNDVVGRVVGWEITFRGDDGTIVVDSNGHEADIDVARRVQMQADTAAVTIDGLDEVVHDQIASGGYPNATIRLGWTDLGTGIGAFVDDYTGLLTSADLSSIPTVFTGVLRSVELRAGDVRYRTHITLRDADSFALESSTVGSDWAPPSEGTLHDHALAVAKVAGVTLDVYGTGRDATEIIPPVTFDAGTSARAALEALARRTQPTSSGRRTPLAKRDGVHFGPWSAPLTRAGTFDLTAMTGLVEATPVTAGTPPTQRYAPPEPAKTAHRLTLLGRPDLGPGDLVNVDVRPVSAAPSSPFGAVGDVVSAVASLASSPVEPVLSPFRVTRVQHRSGPRAGFVTTVEAEPQPVDDSEPEVDTTSSAPASESLARVLERRIAEAVDGGRALDVGIVDRSHTGEATPTARAQRLDVAENLAAHAGGNAPVRAPVADEPSTARNIPYLTPFAVGTAGLVLPHYPGSRVADLHYRDSIADAMVAGCLWEEGNEPAAAKPGDWWLCLPTDLVTEEGAFVAAPDDGPPVTSAPAAHDLIDGHGSRTIHVKGFRIQVGEGFMPAPGGRPTNLPVSTVEISSENGGASIVIDEEGNITISTEKTITFAANDIVMDTQSGVNVL